MVVVTLGDALLDVIVRLDEPLAAGSDVRAATRTGAGGQAANVAAWAVSLGAEARVVAAIGDDAAAGLVRNELAAGVVAIRIIGEQHPQPILDRDAGRHDQEGTGELPAARMADCVDGLPRDQHRHDGRLPCAGSQLQRKTDQLRV